MAMGLFGYEVVSGCRWGIFGWSLGVSGGLWRVSGVPLGRLWGVSGGSWGAGRGNHPEVQKPL